MCVAGVIFWCLTKLFELTRYADFAGYTFAFISLLMTVYAFLLPLNVGTINAFIIANPEPLFRNVNVVVDVAVITLFSIVFVWLIRSNKVVCVWIKNILILCIAGSLFNSVFILWSTQEAWSRDAENTQTVDLPDYNDRLFGFSKEGQNVVVVMLDAFAGRHLDRIMQETPTLKNQYKGFTWCVGNRSFHYFKPSVHYL